MWLQLPTTAAPTPKCNLQNSRICSIVFMVIGIAVMIAGSVTSNFITNTLDSTVASGLILTSDQSLGYPGWKSNTKPTDLPGYKHFYLFNVTNHEAYMAGREDLAVTEIGPFVYRCVCGPGVLSYRCCPLTTVWMRAFVYEMWVDTGSILSILMSAGPMEK